MQTLIQCNIFITIKYEYNDAHARTQLYIHNYSILIYYSLLARTEDFNDFHFSFIFH